MWKPDYVTRVEAKSFMDDTTTVHDVDIDGYIAAASRAIDKHTGRQFGSAAGTRFYTAWYDYVSCVWRVDIDDVQDATGFAVTVAGVAVTTFTKEPINAAADGKPWESLTFDPRLGPVPTGARHEVGVTANPFGWTSTPVAVKNATKLQVNRLASRRVSPFGVAGSPDSGSEVRLLARLDPDVAVSLTDYVRSRLPA